MPVLKLENICKSYIDSGTEVKILKNISFELQSGKSLAIVGQSGSGKTSLLQIAGLLDQKTSGLLEIMGKNIDTLSESEKISLMRQDVAFIHQFHHLFPEFSALENVLIPQLNLGIERKIAEQNAARILEDLGLEKRLNFHPWQLSGGERQRVAMARAVINNPKLILADEPTGSLDPENSAVVIDLLFKICKQKDAAILLVTHSAEIAERADGIYKINR